METTIQSEVQNTLKKAKHLVYLVLMQFFKSLTTSNSIDNIKKAKFS